MNEIDGTLTQRKEQEKRMSPKPAGIELTGDAARTMSARTPVVDRVPPAGRTIQLGWDGDSTAALLDSSYSQYTYSSCYLLDHLVCFVYRPRADGADAPRTLHQPRTHAAWMVNKFAKESSVKVQVLHIKVTCKLNHSIKAMSHRKADPSSQIGHCLDMHQRDYLPRIIFRRVRAKMFFNLCDLIVNVNFRWPSDEKFIGVMELGVQVHLKQA
ncbi:hypothetical protein B0H14DRAFT_2640162 [Mycena olivaceomarginata]|nr:hypothetical protein B0H14DRAFT_2640162 [Mycena olivaceomarginata]